MSEVETEVVQDSLDVEEVATEAPKVDMVNIDFTYADEIIARLAESRKIHNREIREVFKKLEPRVTEQLPKGYKISLELESISKCIHPRLRVEGPNRGVSIDINQKKFNIHEALARSIRWSCKDLGERKIARIWKVDESAQEATKNE